jgi:hypothetical protein
MDRIICKWCGQGFREPKDGSIGCPKCGGPFLENKSPRRSEFIDYDAEPWDGRTGTPIHWQPYASLSESVSLSPSVSCSPSQSLEIPEDEIRPKRSMWLRIFRARGWLK